MNTPNPLVPQGSLLDKGKSHFRITVFATLAVHVVLLCVLLIAGCNKKAEQTTDTSLPPATDTTAWPTSAVPPTPPPPPPPTQEVVVTPTPPPPITPFQPPTPTPPPAEPLVSAGSEHTIVKGETFDSIGKKYGVGYKAIEAANPGMSPTRLKIGDKIKIPPAKSPSAGLATSSLAGNGTGADGVKTYKVKSGDNLGKIGKAYGVTPKQLRAANNLKTDQIKVGQTLKIPANTGTGPTGEPAAPPPVPPPGLPQP